MARVPRKHGRRRREPQPDGITLLVSLSNGRHSIATEAVWIPPKQSGTLQGQCYATEDGEVVLYTHTTQLRRTVLAERADRAPLITLTEKETNPRQP